MLFLWDSIAFLHFPKTGGRTTREILIKKYGIPKIYSEREGKHSPLEVLIDKFNIDITGLKIYATIRNPYQMIVSLYFWLRRNKKEQIDPKMSFDDFIDWYVANRNSYKEFYSVKKKYQTLFV